MVDVIAEFMAWSCVVVGLAFLFDWEGRGVGQRAFGVAASGFRVVWAWAIYLAVPELRPGLFVFIWLEIAMGFLGGLNSLVCVDVDRRPVAWAIPCLYFLSAFIVPVGGVGRGGDSLLLLSALPRLIALWYLGAGFTSGVSSFYRLVDRGPYALVRHPLELSGVIARGVFLALNPSLINVVGYGAFCGVAVLCVLVEEGYLSKFANWRTYSDRVRWRLFPGVW